MYKLFKLILLLVVLECVDIGRNTEGEGSLLGLS